MQASTGLDTSVEWSPDPDGCPDRFTLAMHVCSSVRSQNSRLLGASNEGDWKWSCTLMRGV